MEAETIGPVYRPGKSEVFASELRITQDQLEHPEVFAAALRQCAEAHAIYFEQRYGKPPAAVFVRITVEAMSPLPTEEDDDGEQGSADPG